MQIRFRPLVLNDWPQDTPKTPDRERKRPRWGRDWQAVIDLLRSELEHLGVSEVVIQAGLRDEDLRVDGWPRGNAVFSTPAVIVSFEDSNGEWQSYPSDTFWNYQTNVQAVAMTLNRLRLIEEYGCAKRGQQYRGWKALGSGSSDRAAPTLFRTPVEAAGFIAEHGGARADHVLEIADVLDAAYRRASKKLHPDAPAGSTEAFQKLEQAKAMIIDQQRARGIR